MANQVRYYDTRAMRSAASDIRAKIRNYKSANDEINSTINNMKSYWDDEVNQNFVRRYNSDLKQTADSVMKLMEEYAKFLDATADAYDKAIASGNAGING